MLQVIKILPDNVNMSKYHQRIEVPNLEVLHLIRFFMGWGFPYIGLTYCVQKWVHPFWALEEHCNMQVSVLVRPKIWYLHIVCTRLACTTVYTMCMCTCISIHIHVTPLFWSYIFMWNPFGSKSQGKKIQLAGEDPLQDLCDGSASSWKWKERMGGSFQRQRTFGSTKIYYG